MELLASFLSFSTNSLLVLTCVVLFFCYCLKEKSRYWLKRGVPYISMSSCFLEIIKVIRQKAIFLGIANEQYQLLQGHRFGGIFTFSKPGLIVRDPEMIRQLLIKQFSSFHDRPQPEDDKLSGFLFNMKGEKWRNVRKLVSPAFSSGALKTMHENLRECAEELNAHIQNLCSTVGETEVDVKEFMENYTMDVIGACALGIKCNAVQTNENEFKQVVAEVTKFNLRAILMIILSAIHPKLPNLVGLSTNPKYIHFFNTLTQQSMEMKAKSGSQRRDLLKTLMNVLSSEKQKLINSTTTQSGTVFNEDLMPGIVASFLIAGLHPVAGTLSFCLYEIAKNPEVQDKIWNEIQSVKVEVDDILSYDSLKKFKYIDQVINETLRKYPVAVALMRSCTEPCQLTDSLIIEKDTEVTIPVYGIHHDAKYYNEPEKFDPERFSEKNLEKIVPGTYMPFGEGPRFCIAMRFALMDVKTMVITMLSNYKVLTCPRTPKKIEFDRSVFTLVPEGQLWLRLQKRE